MDGFLESKISIKITIANHLHVLKFHLIGTLLMIITLGFFSFQKELLIIFSITWMVYTIPALFLHVEYYLANRNQQLTIIENQIILQERDGHVTNYPFHHLQSVETYRSASLEKGGMQLSSIESYHYACITCVDGKKIFITCLLSPDIEKITNRLNGVPHERKKRLFASLHFTLRILPDK